MNFKLFGLVWNLKPVLLFMWYMVVVVLFCVFLAGALGDNLLLALAGFFASALWAYITNTIESNN